MIQRLQVRYVSDVFVGRNHSFIICDEIKRIKSEKKKYQILRCWGHNHYGQLGLGHLEQSVFTQVENEFFRDKDIKSITGGDGHTLVLTKSNELYGMGRNDDGQLGFSNIENDSEGKLIYTYPIPKKIDHSLINSITSASNYNYGLDTINNLAYSWGFGQNYVLGNKSDSNQLVITQVPKDFFKNKIIGQVRLLYLYQIAIGACHVVAGLYETEENDKIIVPELDSDYLEEYKKLIVEKIIVKRTKRKKVEKVEKPKAKKVKNDKKEKKDEKPKVKKDKLISKSKSKSKSRSRSRSIKK